MRRKGPHITKDSGIVILILGQTGTGKSTFINAAAGQNVAEVNHSLTSCKLEIQDFSVQHPQHSGSFIFVDPPGFDHYSATDGEVLKLIFDWLKKSCEPDVAFGGIVYLHDINASRDQSTTGAPLAIAGLTRPEPARHVLMATVKWRRAQIHPDPLAESREQELESNSWKKILDGGARMRRFANTDRSAWDIVDALVETGPLKLDVLQNDLDRIQRYFPKAPFRHRLKRFREGLFAKFFTSRV